MIGFDGVVVGGVRTKIVLIDWGVGVSLVLLLYKGSFTYSLSGGFMMFSAKVDIFCDILFNWCY